MPIDHQQILDSLDCHVVLLKNNGEITYVNQSWIRFGQENGLPPGHNWLGRNYLDACADPETPDQNVAAGILDVLAGRRDSYYHEYPCHSAKEPRWFLMRVVPLPGSRDHCVITHFNITDRKQIEEKVAYLSLHDVLTGLGNRRHFLEVYRRAWLRHLRHRQPLSLLMIDIDYFKAYNDAFGHVAGDRCLEQVAQVLARHAQRADDCTVRYGGEEFLVLLSDTPQDKALAVAEAMRKEVAALPLRQADDRPVTISIGLASATPAQTAGGPLLVELADRMLYQAKNRGRNQVCHAGETPLPHAPALPCHGPECKHCPPSHKPHWCPSR
ncbi:hypothetical protein CEK28_08010 [Xenophilus sp. AP218F]|nr:sensor domain-containing diguanylate cyclase [Chromobacterium sp. ASV5]OWY39410.1 hypothetical protein CEK28_08010 [Xenophilus sp. AP218F]